MKKILYIIFILYSLNSFSQDSSYTPFPVIQGEWSFMLYDDFWNPTYSFGNNTLLGDTIIGDSIYKKIFTSGFWGNGTEMYVGSIREHEKVIYFIPDTSSTEIVLYDFNLLVGDTIYNPFIETIDDLGEYMVLEYIDTGINNEYFFDNGAFWIEGVGNEQNLLIPSQGYSVSGGYIIYCMINDGDILVGGSNCLVSINETQIFNNEISIFPNPSYSNFTIKLENSLIKEILVLDSSGRSLIIEKDLNQSQFTIGNLPIGVYILKLIDDKGRSSIRKLISSP